jgi:hypothetical protein
MPRGVYLDAMPINFDEKRPLKRICRTRPESLLYRPIRREHARSVRKDTPIESVSTPEDSILLRYYNRPQSAMISKMAFSINNHFGKEWDGVDPSRAARPGCSDRPSPTASGSIATTWPGHCARKA